MKEADSVVTEQSKERKSRKVRHPVTQEQIDEILRYELKDYKFPVKPIYNPRIKNNGKTIAEVNRWGRIERIKAIEIGKQDKPGKEFLIDTILHEYLESEIWMKQGSDLFYKKLSESDENTRHGWIYSEITDFFKRLEKNS